MLFSRDGDVYKVARITGSQDNFLAVIFSDHDCSVQLVECPGSGALAKSGVVRTTGDELLRQVAEGLVEEGASVET